MTSILNYFGLSKGECPYRIRNDLKISHNGTLEYGAHNITSLLTVGLPLALCVGSINSLAAIAFQMNPIIPAIIGAVVFLTSHSIDMVAHLVNDDHHQKTSHNVMRYSSTLFYSLCLFQATAHIYPTPITPAAKVCFVIIPNAIDWALQYYFHKKA